MARVHVKLKGIHKVRKRLADGSLAEYHYAWRGGPRIWDRSKPFSVHSIDYVEAYRAATNSLIETRGTFQKVIDEFLSSSEFAQLGVRTQRDHRQNIVRPKGIEDVFGRAPIEAFEDKRIRAQIMRWRDSFSEGTGDQMMATMQRIISFAYDRGLIGEHHLLKIKRRTKSNRAHIIWTQAEIDQFVAGAPVYVGRILVAAVETGFRPGDLQVFSRKDIERRNSDQARILLRTRKSRKRNYASVPVTPRLATLIAELPADQERIIVTSEGKPFEKTDSMGQLISFWRDFLGIRKELRLYDARGTAVTRLVRANCSLSELATHMGWSFQHAAHMLERYAALDPDMADGILEKVLKREMRTAE
ncbi:hypothetical protein FHG66_12785 [Rubellimicrobium rubrum]|uniref:Tyr recombinase domain-containing protein n=1 Tax=Rubellimicrobium rubrum TaxID=2585369 RepID=A0A5C4MY66_9RHOB|nr:hypothetical protein [Rubellimicrobium rubrum]TNC49031.1 hypothetical protein FHG66_12785 [Rubellimicrobium rubrum]